MTKWTAPQNPFIVSMPWHGHDEFGHEPSQLPAINRDHFLNIMDRYANYLSTRGLKTKFSGEDKENYIRWLSVYTLYDGGFPDLADFQTVAWWMIDSGYLKKHHVKGLAKQVREDYANDQQ